MNDVTYNDDEKRVLYLCALKCQQKSYSQHHAWDGVGDKSDTVQYFSKGVTESASRRNQSRSVNDQGAQGCCKNGRQQRVLVDSDQALVTEGRLDMI